MKREERGNADGSDTSDEEEYNYPQSQPIDVSFFDPEIIEQTAPCSTCDIFPRSFEGPKIKSQKAKNVRTNSHLLQKPKPPPRPQLPGSDGKTEGQPNRKAGYEVTAIEIPVRSTSHYADGIQIILTMFPGKPVRLSIG